MPLIDLPLPPREAGLPPDVRRFLRDAEKRIDDFQVESRVPAFVPSDYADAYRVLRALADSSLLRGNCFCEWGSGFGVVASLAALVGFDAYGIEIADELVTHARQLADDYELEIEFVRGSFIPRGAEDRIHRSGEYAWMTTDEGDAYEELGNDLEDFDVIFAYPWPDEAVVTGDLFDRYAGIGAVLVTYHGGDEFRVRRKVASRKRRKDHSIGS